MKGSNIGVEFFQLRQCKKCELLYSIVIRNYAHKYNGPISSKGLCLSHNAQTERMFKFQIKFFRVERLSDIIVHS